MIRSARVWDQCQSIWSGRITSRADPFACHASAPPFNLGLRQELDCCRLAPNLYLTIMAYPSLQLGLRGPWRFPESTAVNNAAVNNPAVNNDAVNLTASDDNQRGNQEKLGSSLVRTGKALS